MKIFLACLYVIPLAVLGGIAYLVATVDRAPEQLPPAAIATSDDDSRHCHGHALPDGSWTLNLDSWSDAEMAEVNALAEKIKALDPADKSHPADIAGMLDRFECSGVPHAKAIENILGLAKSMGSINAGQP